MAIAAVIGLNGGKRLLSSSYHYSDIVEKFSHASDFASTQYHLPSSKSPPILAKKLSKSPPTSPPSQSHDHSIKALKEHAVTDSEQCFQGYTSIDIDVANYSLEALLLLQKSMLEKQWGLSFEREKIRRKVAVTCSGVSARQRRINSKRKISSKSASSMMHLRSTISPELIQNRFKGYVKGVVSQELLSHAEVVKLSVKIKAGLSLDEHKSRLKERLGCEPSHDQVATSLKISRAELRAKIIECSLAREKLTMSNVRLVMSIAQRYDNMGAEMADLVQGGLIGLLGGIEKFDSSKGCKISTYVYWWIRQGVSRALVGNSRTLRLPTHLHNRLYLIRNAQAKMKGFGAGAGTILFFEDESAIKKLQDSFPLYASAFPGFAEHTSGMVQFIVWTALEAEGLGCSLQHYSPLVDETIQKEWGVPSTWKLKSQMPFGNPIAAPGEKTFQPIEDRVKVFH